MNYEVENGSLAIYVFFKDKIVAEYQALTHGGWVGGYYVDGIFHRFNGGDAFFSRSEVKQHIKDRYKVGEF